MVICFAIVAIPALYFIEQESTFPVILFLFCCAVGVLAVVAPPALFQRLVPTTSEPVPWQTVGVVAVAILGLLALFAGLEGLSAGLILTLVFIGYACAVWLFFKAVAFPFDSFKKAMHAIREKTDNMPSPRLIATMDKCMWIFASACSVVYSLGYIILVFMLPTRSGNYVQKIQVVSINGSNDFDDDFDDYVSTQYGYLDDGSIWFDTDLLCIMLGSTGAATLFYLSCLMRVSHRDRQRASEKEVSDDQEPTTPTDSLDNAEENQIV